MKKLSLLLVTFFATNAFACPDLTGTYSCKYDDGETDTIEFTQRVENGVTIYTIGGQDLPANGETVEINEEEDGVQLIGTASGLCSAQGDEFDTSMDLDVIFDGSLLMMITAEFTYSKDGADLRSVGTTVVTDPSTGSKRVTLEDMICGKI